MTHSQEKNIEYWLALSSVKGVSTARIKRLIEHFGSIEAVFDATLSEIERIPSFGNTLASRICANIGELPMFREKLGALQAQNIRLLTLDDPDYPERLKTIPNPPSILCQLGEFTEIDASCVAIVGTREPTREAFELTLGLSIQLTRAGFTVVSGLAGGIDTCAHIGALERSGKTIAVMGTDVLTIYPSKNRDLASKIKDYGCLLSEHPFPVPPTQRNLVQRNRIISGISQAIIVIEARARSGTMHTAKFAKDQGRPLIVCQSEDERGCEGTRALIQDGAFSFTSEGIDEIGGMLQHPDMKSRMDASGLFVRDDVRNHTEDTLAIHSPV